MASMKRNVRVVQLELRLVTDSVGNCKVEANLKHRCKDKQSAVELIQQYCDRNTRVKGKEA